MVKHEDERAFPVTMEDGRGQSMTNLGMTLRDYFAIHATHVTDEVGIGYAERVVGRDMPRFESDPLGNSAFWAAYRSRMRYIEADAMLAERAK